MKSPAGRDLGQLWAHHNAEWRDPAQVASQWQEAVQTDPRMLRHTSQGVWWETLAAGGITLLVTREYEHLLMGLHAGQHGPHVSFMRLPHPSGLVVQRKRALVYVASTRNPNQVYELRPVTGLLPRLDVKTRGVAEERPLIPSRSRFFPGCLYVHDLALIGNELYANAVGQNAVVRLDEDGRYERVWWPRCIEEHGAPLFTQNYIQLNSMAAGHDLRTSYFSASADRISARRPGHRNYPVDGRGVIFSGSTREPVVGGLTRPHSARWHAGRLWVDNSGYGEFGYVDIRAGKFVVVSRLPGWTRGLCFQGEVAYIGTSRVLPRFRTYAPGVDAESSVCALHAVDIQTGKILGSLKWPYGNQIFAIDWMSEATTTGFPFVAGRKRTIRDKALFYAFQPA
jgi:uncharacterized protein (TIGR03032 family)